MISFMSIWAIAIRHLRVIRRNPNLLLAIFYWPILDVLVMGYLGSWIQQMQGGHSHNYEMVTLLGLLLWQVVGRGSNNIITAFSEELWTNNVINLFSLPLRIIEWIGGAIIFYTLMIVFIAFSSMGVIALFYNVSLWYLFTTFLLFLPPLFLAGIWLGFMALQIIVTFGKRGVELGYVIGWFLLPFSGAYYPIEVLPQWGQKLSSVFPMSYVFQGMREYVLYQKIPISYLLKGYVLSVFYAVFSVLLFVYCFNKSKQKGLARLAD